MNRLNKFVISFVLPFFCLLMSVSYAEFSETTPVSSGNFSIRANNTTSGGQAIKFGDYNLYDFLNYAVSYAEGGYENAPTGIVTNYHAIYDYLTNNNYSVMVSSDGKQILVGPSDIDFGYLESDNMFYFYANSGDVVYYAKKESSMNRFFTITCTSSGYTYNFGSPIISFIPPTQEYLCNKSIKKIYISAGCFWDGTYYYKVGSDEPETPSLPSNAEIAQAVQAFYDSDLYKNNSNFKDFMVVYSFITGYYSIIGTDNHLLQEIYYDGAKPSNEDFTYPETWWRFYNYFGNAQNLFYGWDYWLYSTRKEDDSFSPISYDGVGKINDLFKLKFTNQSIIVYSSYEYKVYEFRPPAEEGGSNSSTVTTIPGDEYTYDENLDPTDSEYSPIQNYIPTNPSQSILGDVDFDEINKTFEENKGILNIENARWLFTANNQFVGYFIGFLSLLIVFLIISRILGG